MTRTTQIAIAAGLVGLVLMTRKRDPKRKAAIEDYQRRIEESDQQEIATDTPAVKAEVIKVLDGLSNLGVADVAAPNWAELVRSGAASFSMKRLAPRAYEVTITHGGEKLTTLATVTPSGVKLSGAGPRMKIAAKKGKERAASRRAAADAKRKRAIEAAQRRRADQAAAAEAGRKRKADQEWLRAAQQTVQERKGEAAERAINLAISNNLLPETDSRDKIVKWARMKGMGRSAVSPKGYRSVGVYVNVLGPPHGPIASSKFIPSKYTVTLRKVYIGEDGKKYRHALHMTKHANGIVFTNPPGRWQDDEPASDAAEVAFSTTEHGNKNLGLADMGYLGSYL